MLRPYLSAVCMNRLRKISLRESLFAFLHLTRLFLALWLLYLGFYRHTPIMLMTYRDFGAEVPPYLGTVRHLYDFTVACSWCAFTAAICLITMNVLILSRRGVRSWLVSALDAINSMLLIAACVIVVQSWDSLNDLLIAVGAGIL